MKFTTISKIPNTSQILIIPFFVRITIILDFEVETYETCIKLIMS